MAKGSIEISIRDVPEVKAELKKYDKALEKLCKELADATCVMCAHCKNFFCDKCFYKHKLTIDDWKKWAFEDEA